MIDDLSTHRTNKQKALTELKAARAISTGSWTRALAEARFFAGDMDDKSSPNYHYAQRLDQMCEIENRITNAIRLLEGKR